MAVLAVALFGSRARGDENPASDIDLLLVTAAGRPRHGSVGKISMSFYPLPDLHARARSGNLFLCHVLREGQALYDPEGRLDQLRSEFRLRSSYAGQIAQAADLGWLIARFGSAYPDTDLLRRRIAWCVRTILIGRSAERGAPVFAPRELARLGPPVITGRLIAQKDAAALLPTALEDLAAFLVAEGFEDSASSASAPEEFERRFRETDNAVALHFVRRAELSRDYV